jgi:anti-sigma B factor antagonist
MWLFKKKTMLKTKRLKGVLVVSFNVDLIAEQQLQNIGRELMDSADAAASYEGKLLLDFAGVKGMCSAMIGKLVILNKWCKDRKVVLKMCNVSRDLLERIRRELSGGDDAA